MADTRVLLAGLQAFSTSFRRHAQQIGEDYHHLHQSFLRLSFTFQGDAADEFYARWTRTSEVFREFIDKSDKMNQLLLESIQALTEANRPEGS